MDNTLRGPTSCTNRPGTCVRTSVHLGPEPCQHAVSREPDRRRHAKLLEFDSDVGTVLVAVAASPGELAPVGKAADVVERIATSMGDVLAIAGGVAKGFADAIADAPVETAELEFGLQFTAKGSLYIVATEAQGAIRVTLQVRPTQHAD